MDRIDRKKLDVICSAERIEMLAAHRRQLSERITLAAGKEKSILQPAYAELENAFQKCILAEAKFLIGI